jgi:hypothetical protein
MEEGAAREVIGIIHHHAAKLILRYWTVEGYLSMCTLVGSAVTFVHVYSNELSGR